MFAGIPDLGRHGAWKDNESLWSTTLADHPGAYGAMHGLAVVRLDQERFDEAEALLLKALKSPGIDEWKRAAMLDDLGSTYAAAGKFEQALPVFIEILELGESARRHFNLGLTLVALGRYEDGERHLRRAIELKPYYQGLHNTDRTRSPPRRRGRGRAAARQQPVPPH